MKYLKIFNCFFMLFIFGNSLHSIVIDVVIPCHSKDKILLDDVIKVLEKMERGQEG